MQQKPEEKANGGRATEEAVLCKLARRLANPDFPPGDRAALRRMDPRSPGRAGLVLHRLLAECGLPAPRGDETIRWALIVHCLALARGRHDDKRSAGKALHKILHQSDQRLTQLLSADIDLLFDLLPRLARRIGAAAESIDWEPFMRIVLRTGRNPAAEEEAERQRLQIASDYARAQTANRETA